MTVKDKTRIVWWATEKLDDYAYAGDRGAVTRIYAKARLFIRGRNARRRALEDAYQEALEILQDVEEGGGSVG
jgi:ubiquinone biosynthesis protein COQ9